MTPGVLQKGAKIPAKESQLGEQLRRACRKGGITQLTPWASPCDHAEADLWFNFNITHTFLTRFFDWCLYFVCVSCTSLAGKMVGCSFEHHRFYFGFFFSSWYSGF